MDTAQMYGTPYTPQCDINSETQQKHVLFSATRPLEDGRCGRYITVWRSRIGDGLGYMRPEFESGGRGFSFMTTLRRARFMTILGSSGVELPDRRPHPVSSLRLGEPPPRIVAARLRTPLATASRVYSFPTWQHECHMAKFNS